MGAAVMAAVVMAGCASGDRTVSMRGVDFLPETVTVKAGATVTWVNDDTWDHTVTSTGGGPLDSGAIVPGTRFRFVFTEPGTYAYHCIPHTSKYPDGSVAGMTGVVIVEA